MKKLLKNNKGFTLIELMIVVVIIGILAAIAIPNFLRYQLKSRFSEAGINTKGAFTANMAYQAKYRVFGLASPYPTVFDTEGKAIWDSSPGVTPPSGNFYTIGFTPSGTVRYQYGIADGDVALDGTSTATLVPAAAQIAYDAGGTITNAVGTGIVNDVPAAVDFTLIASADLDTDTVYGQVRQTDVDTKVQPYVDTTLNAVSGEDIF